MSQNFNKLIWSVSGTISILIFGGLGLVAWVMVFTAWLKIKPSYFHIPYEKNNGAINLNLFVLSVAPLAILFLCYYTISTSTNASIFSFVDRINYFPPISYLHSESAIAAYDFSSSKFVFQQYCYLWSIGFAIAFPFCIFSTTKYSALIPYIIKNTMGPKTALIVKFVLLLLFLFCLYIAYFSENLWTKSLASESVRVRTRGLGLLWSNTLFLGFLTSSLVFWTTFPDEIVD